MGGSALSCSLSWRHPLYNVTNTTSLGSGHFQKCTGAGTTDHAPDERSIVQAPAVAILVFVENLLPEKGRRTVHRIPEFMVQFLLSLSLANAKELRDWMLECGSFDVVRQIGDHLPVATLDGDGEPRT
jgi:hypothetical protein